MKRPATDPLGQGEAITGPALVADKSAVAVLVIKPEPVLSTAYRARSMPIDESALVYPKLRKDKLPVTSRCVFNV